MYWTVDTMIESSVGNLMIYCVTNFLICGGNHGVTRVV